MIALEELDVVILHQHAGLPDIALDLDDTDGLPVDLTTGYSDFSAKLVDLNGNEMGITDFTVSPTQTGFLVALPAAGLAVNEGEYLLQAQAAIDTAKRFAYCRVQVLTGY